MIDVINGLYLGTIREMCKEMYCEAEGLINNFDFDLKGYNTYSGYIRMANEEEGEEFIPTYGIKMTCNEFSWNEPLILLGVYGSEHCPVVLNMTNETTLDDIINFIVNYVSELDGDVDKNTLIIAKEG